MSTNHQPERVIDNTDYKHLARTNRQIKLAVESPVKYVLGTDDYHDIRVVYLNYDIPVVAKEDTKISSIDNELHKKVQRCINEFMQRDGTIHRHIFADDFSTDTVAKGSRTKYQGSIYFSYKKAPAAKIQEMAHRFDSLIESVNAAVLPELNKNFTIKQ